MNDHSCISRDYILNHYVYLPFEKLEVWKLAKDFVVKIYKITERFPPEEKFGMVSQLRRASLSISSNLAEGSGRHTARDQGHFYEMAYSSLMEALNQIIISVDLCWISESELLCLRKEVEVISFKINALRKSIL